MKRSICRKLKRSVSGILAASMSLSLFTGVPVSAEIGKTTYNYDGYSVDYNITNEWDGAQIVELTVSNTGTDSILNWALKYDAEGEINNLWNADLYEQNGSEYVIKNTGWNFEIAPNQSVTYGYTLNGSDLSLPDSFEIYSKRVQKTEGYDVSYNITKSWDTGVEGNIVISNTSNAAIEAWTLSFDSNFNVDHLWNGRVLENNGASYTVAAEVWTNPVQPNSTMTIGFVGSKAADVEALLSNFRLTEVVIGEGTPVIPIDPPVEDIEISANAALQENGDITVSWTSNKQEGTFDILMSADGVNFTSVGTVVGASEYLYTPESDFETLYFKVVQTVGEQSAQSNVVSVVNNKPSEDIIISAKGVYDEESGNITVSWETNTDNGAFEIFVSNDGENFTSVGTVTGASECLYTPESDFETLYFKVVQIVGEHSAQSNIVPIINTKPTEAIIIAANGVYDEESGDITISWETNTDNGSFEIFISEDGEKFVSIGTVEGVSEYVYTLATDFEEIYFKVIQTAGDRSAESNVVTIKGSIVLSVITSANYDEESGNIKVSWITSFDKGTYEIFVSEDDENFTSLGIIENAKEYIYTPEEEFTVLYFKVKQTVGELKAESQSAAAYYPIDWEDETDTDSDGLTDVYEKYYFETDPTNPDTDGDGLPDGYEVYYLGTDPKKADSDENGISDGDEDFDKDGLSNKCEYELDTDPNNDDTDNDSLSDSEEVNTYNTDPLKFDTDEDGISDGDEIALGLDPTSAATDGTPDSERTFVQHVGADSENLATVNTSENPFEVSIDITAAGVASNNLYSQKSGYSNAIKNDAILGVTPEFIYTDGLKVEDVIINFTIDNSAVNNYNNKYTGISDEFVGIKRLNVFKFFEDTNMLLPIETFHDVENNRVYTHVDELGTYCLMDMEIWLENLGITAEDLADNTNAATFSARSMPVLYNDDNEVRVQSEQKYLDVVLVAYPNNSLIDETRAELKITSEEIFNRAAEENFDARIYFIDFLGGSIKTTDGKLYAETYEEAVSIINRQPTINDGHSEASFALYKALNYVNSTILKEFRPDSKRYCFVIDVGGYPATDIKLGAVPALKENDVVIGFSYNRGNTNADKYMLLATNAICEQAVIGNGRYNFGDFIIKNIFENNTQGHILITSTGLKSLPDDYKDITKMSNSDYDTYDYDHDRVPDNGEIILDLLRTEEDGTVSYPYFYEIEKEYGDKLFYVEKGLLRLEKDLGNNFKKYKKLIKILPIQSDPTNPDSDGDGIGDFEEYIHKTRSGFNPLKEDMVIIKDNLINDSDCIKKKKTDYSGLNDDGYVSAEAISKGEYNNDGSETIMRPVLNFNRYVNSTSVFTIVPEKNCDYIISTSENSKVTVEQKGLLWSYSPLSNDSFYDTKVEGQTGVILEKGKTYRITIENFNDQPQEYKLYDVNIWQDNWVCAPYGALVKSSCISANSTFIDTKNELVLNNYKKFYFSEKTIKDLTPGSDWNNINNAANFYDGVAASLAYYFFIDEEYDTSAEDVKVILDELSIIFTYASVFLIKGDEILSAIVTFSGAGTTFLGGFFDDDYLATRQKLEEELKESLIIGHDITLETYSLNDSNPDIAPIVSKHSLGNWNGAYINKYYDGEFKEERFDEIILGIAVVELNDLL